MTILKQLIAKLIRLKGKEEDLKMLTGKSNKLSFVILSTMMFSLFSCVGTVKDKNLSESNVASSQGNSTPISFEGLARVTPISNTKVELFFYEAVTSANEVVYEIYVNNSAVPIKLSSKSVPKVSGGLLLFTVPNLETNTTYSFNMRAVPAGDTSKVSLDAAKTLFTTTFNNETADFLGITSATTLSGMDGKSKVLVKWVAAHDDGLDNLTSTNPYQYEISYITNLGGVANINNPGLTTPTRNIKIISATSSEFKNTGGVVVDGLATGTQYFFQVRAIHYGWNMYSLTIPNYKREQNSKFASATTLSNTSTTIFDRPQLTLSNPIGAIGLSSLDLNWNAATGAFNNYYVCYIKNELTNDLINISSNTDISSLLGVASGINCISIDAGMTYYRLINLDQYSTYQVKIVACITLSCDGSNRIVSSEFTTKKVETPVSQFNGITSIVDPTSYTDASDLKKITLNYSPAVRNTGYITKLIVKCYNSSTDTTGVIIPLPGNGSATSPGNVCDGITQVSTTIPDELTGNSADSAFYSNAVKQTVLQLNNDINNNTQYCFSITPQITGPGAIVINGQVIIKCTIPKIVTPSIFDFPGKSLGCQVQNGKDLQIVWPQSKQNPGGILSGYIVFWKEKTIVTDYFNFSEARTAYVNSGYVANAPNGSTYKWQKITDKNTISTVLNTLNAGKIYSIAVLPYFSTNTLNLFGQDNFNIDDCAIPLPKAKFNEWVDIFAIGPKEDGLTPGHNNYFLETLDDDGIPVEVKIAANDANFTPDDINKRGGSTFDGIYGSKDDAKSSNYNQYSNSGIIKIAWKEITLNVADTINAYYTAVGGDLKADNITPAEKPDRKYGYKVYRSSDNKKTWVNLTAANNNSSNINFYQSSLNAGLIHSESKTTKELNNGPDVTYDIATFTDYSVRFSDSNGDIDRARVYYYKVVPVYNGKELIYEDSTNPNHHILRVTLPPRNMALVHRLMANRTLCLELNSTGHTRTLNKTASGYYSCEYDGVGAKGLSSPWSIGATVIDQGGDLLIDRYELSCPFSRGSEVNGGDYANSTVPNGVDLLTFNGTSSGGSTYKGCYNPNSTVQYDPGKGTIVGSSQASYGQVLPGDCFGSDLPIIATRSTSSVACPLGNALSSKFPYYYPGTPVTDPSATLDCSNPGNNSGPTYLDFFDPSSAVNTTSAAPTQSEYAAIYYMRSAYNMGDSTYTPSRLIGGQTDNSKVSPGSLTYSSEARQNSCMVNLPFKNSGGYWRPRWISLNSLFGRLQYRKDPASPVADETNLDIHNKSINEITNDPHFYNSTIGTGIPDNINTSLAARKINPSTTPLARIATSNSAKLPPLSGLNQIALQQICNAYTIEVGIDSSSGNDTSAFKALESKAKRLLRRTEQINSAAWSTNFNESTVTNLERGANLSSNGDPNTSCNTIDRSAKNGDNLYSFGVTFSSSFPHYNRPTHAPFITGSSSVDGGESSEKCVSRYGVQDLVGNMQEFLGDQLFCNTSDLKMKQDDQSTDVNRNYWSSLIEASGKITVPSTDASGKCSLVDTNENNNIYVSGNSMLDIYTFLGNLNNFIKNPKNSDQESILTARNGNGYFLNFGQNKMAMPLTEADAINFPNTYYFNPIYGIPLSCADSTTCDGDNKRYGISGYTDGNNSSNYYNDKFPINNSILSNDSLKSIALASGNDTRLGVTNPVTIFSNDYTGITYNSTTADSHPYYPITWGVDRTDSSENSATMQLYGGGSFNDQAGRYSLNIKGRNNEAQMRSSETNSDGRCATLINQN
jgi:hypothetical protein